MSLRTLSMLGSRMSTPRYGTLNSHSDLHVSLAAESRTLDRSQPGTFDRSLHTDRSRNGSGFDRSTSMENSRPRNIGRMLDGEERKPPVISPVSFQTFYTQQQPQQQQLQPPVRNGGTRDVYPTPISSTASVGYIDVNYRGTVLTCISFFLTYAL